MSFLGGLVAVRTIQRRAFSRGQDHKRSDRIVKTNNAYHVIWGDDGDKYDGEAYFPTLKDALAFWADTEGQPYSEYWHRQPVFYGISQRKFIDLLHYPCGQVDRELCFGPWGTWKRSHGGPEAGPRILRQTAGEGRAIRSRNRTVGKPAAEVVDTLDQVEGGAYRVTWHEVVAGRPAIREAYFPTLASARRFWTDRPQGENFPEWFRKYEGINSHWYNSWLRRGCAGDNEWLCAGSWSKVTR